MGKGGGNSAPAEQTVRQTNIPEFAEPYFMAAMDDATTLSSQAYTPYGGQRLANQSQDTLNSYGMVRNVAGSGIPYMDQAVGAQRGAMSGVGSIAEGADPFNFGGPQMWNSQIANQYMSPYMTNVADYQKDRAVLDFNRAQQYRDSEAVKAGAFGGSRQGVVDSLAQEGLMRDLQGIDATTRQQAYQDAAGMFQADRGIGFDYQRAQADENRSAAGLGLEAYGMYGQMGQGLAGLGEARRAADIQGAQLLEAAGKAQEGYQQAGLDIGYQDFLDQRDWDQNQLSWYSNILRGVPVEPGFTQTSYVPNNPLKDAAGLGISAIGLYNGLNV